MKMVVDLQLEVNIESDRANANEIFDAVSGAVREVAGKLAGSIVEHYQSRIVEVLCSPSGPVAKKGLGSHEVKADPQKKCRHRRFKRAGYWSETRELRSDVCAMEFRPALVECEACGKRITPVLEALELPRYQSRTDQLLRTVAEAIADTSYRRGSHQLQMLANVPVPKSTAHRWAATIELPVSAGSGQPFLGADGTKFKRQPGERGEVRMVLELGLEGEIRPLGVWAGTAWEQIAREVRAKLKNRPELFISDGERAMEKWLAKLANRSERCHWHLSRDSGFALWEDGAPLQERQQIRKQLSQLLAIELPGGDLETVSAQDQQQLRERIDAAKQQIDELVGQFDQKGYQKAATYLSRARDRLFCHLDLWLETGIIAPRTASILENIIRELVRRLKKVGWNWSDEGATRMGRIVMMRRYDPEGWNTLWRDRLNLQGRCKISIIRFETRRVA